MNVLGVVFAVAMVVGLSTSARAELDREGDKVELLPEFTLVKIVELDRAIHLKGQKKAHPVKMPEEQWNNFPRLIRADFTYVPKSGNKGGGWSSLAIYPHRNFEIEFGGERHTCVGAVPASYRPGEGRIFMPLDKTRKVVQVYNAFGEPKSDTAKKPAFVSPVFMLNEDTKAFKIYYKGHLIATVEGK